MLLSQPDIDRLETWLIENAIEDVEVMMPDMAGIGRGKSMPPTKFIECLRSDGLRIPETLFAMTISGEYLDYVESSHFESREIDLFMCPDPATICKAPWQAEPTALVICDVAYQSGQNVELSPRQALRRVLDLYAERGWQPIVAPEFEFYLLSKERGEDGPFQPPKGISGRRTNIAAAFSVDGVDEFGPLFDDIYDYCETQSIPIETLIHESGPAQFEINFHHGDALNAADRAFYFKRLVRKIAQQHGFDATFMAKPYPVTFGSSMHLHQSIIDTETGKNIFALSNGEDTALFNHYIAGLQNYMAAVMPMLAPYVNSYRRLGASHLSSPVNVQWGRENRTVGLRVPESDAEGRRVENRVPGADVNPYLAIAASLACGYLGMIEQRVPTEPTTDNAYEESRDQHPLPVHFLDGLEVMRNCKEIRGVFGDSLIDTYLSIKEEEHSEFLSVLSSWEVDNLTFFV